MIKKIFFLILIPIAFVFVFSSCNVKEPAVGREDEIYVIADSSEYYALEAPLLEVFSKIIYTPQPEHLFNLTRKSIYQLAQVKNKKNIIIIAPLNSGSKTSNYMKSILDSNVTAMVKSDSLNVINKYNLWARNQLVMFITGTSIKKIKYAILKNHNRLLNYFQKISNERLYAKLYYPKYERKKIEAKFLKEYGWIIYVQADYKLALDLPQDHFVWLRRAPGTDMERWIFVYWINNASPIYLNADSVAAVRNRETKKYYRTSNDSSYVEIADNYKTTKAVNFRGRYALKTLGLWRMSDQSMGGPFVNYTFFDEKTHRIYMIDGSIYAPKYYKKMIIQQIDVMLQSFKTKDEISKERIKELMDALK